MRGHQARSHLRHKREEQLIEHLVRRELAAIVRAGGVPEDGPEGFVTEPREAHVAQRQAGGEADLGRRGRGLVVGESLWITGDHGELAQRLVGGALPLDEQDQRPT